MKSLQITLIVSMGLLLFAAAVLPPVWLGAACVAMLLVVALVARGRPGFERTGLEQRGPQRRWTRAALGMAIAISIIVRALLASRHG